MGRLIPKYIEFDIMHKNEPIENIKIYPREQIVKLSHYTDDIELREFIGDTLTMDELDEWIEDRCFPYERGNRDQLLNDLGLKYYIPFDIVKKTHGILFDDYVWIRFKGEDVKWDDIKIRD